MEICWSSVLVFLALGAPIACSQHVSKPSQQVPIEASICKILEDPSSYNNKLVKLRGLVNIGPENSTLESEGCSESIWLVMGGGASLPGLVAVVNGKGSPGVTDSKGVRKPPVAIKIVRNSNYDEFMSYLELSAKGDSCADGPPPAFPPPDCRTYRVTATFIGRIDGVSKEIHAAHRKRSVQGAVDGKGFGQMGMFDAQLVVQSIEDVAAVDRSATTHLQPKSQ